MKKIVGLMAAAALATSAFAEVNVSSWNRAVVEPIHYDGDTLRTFSGPSWDVGANGSVRSGLSFSGSTENAGIAIDINAEGPSTGDNAYVWVKPIDVLKIGFGKIENNWGRLDHCFGTWDLSRFATEEGEGLAGVARQKGGTGVNVSLQPVEGLVIDYEANLWAGSHTYEAMWEGSSTMIGYQADFGFIRAIINGQSASYKESADIAKKETTPGAQIGVAADITAIENLTLKVGASLPTNLTGFKEVTSVDDLKIWTDGYAPTGYVKAAVAADYNLDAAVIHAQANLAVNPDKVDDGKVKLGAMGIAIGAGVDYALNDTFKVITDVRFHTDKYVASGIDAEGKFTYKDSGFGAYIGLRQQLTNATFDFGAQFAKHNDKNVAATEKDAFTFAIPLTITASF